MKFGIILFEIDYLIKIKWYLIFWPLPRAKGGRAKRNSCILSNGLGGDSITGGQTAGKTEG